MRRCLLFVVFLDVALSKTMMFDRRAWLEAVDWRVEWRRVKRACVRPFRVYDGKMAFLSAAANQADVTHTVVDKDWKDARGRCDIRLSRDALFIRVEGFGTQPVACGAVETLDASFDKLYKLGVPKASITTLVDMRRATACCAGGVRSCVHFVNKHGTALDKVAIVASGLPLQSARVVLLLSPLDNVHVFKTLDAAKLWLTPTDASSHDRRRPSSRPASAIPVNNLPLPVDPTMKPSPAFLSCSTPLSRRQFPVSSRIGPRHRSR